jgi:hypothetical protein
MSGKFLLALAHLSGLDSLTGRRLYPMQGDCLVINTSSAQYLWQRQA